MAKGDFQNGIPNNHKGNKGDTSNDIRSSSELRNAQEGELKNLAPDAQEILEQTTGVDSSQSAESNEKDQTKKDWQVNNI